MKDNQIVKSDNNTGKNGSLAINMLAQFDDFAEYILNSEYRKNFEKTDKNTNTRVVDKGDVVACLVLGNELGISPMGSIVLGKQLNAKSYMSVIRGRELGLDAITSISKIYNIETSNGNILSLAVDLISKSMLDGGCSLDYVRDYELTPTYKVLGSNQYVGHLFNITEKDGKLKPSYFIYNAKSTSVEELTKAVGDGKIVISQSGYTHVTALRVIRSKFNFDNTFYYSLQEAIDAGLYKGFHSTFVDKDNKPVYVDGRSNWNSHPATMLRNRVTSIAGRIAVADRLQGGYSHDEAMEILNVNSETELIEESN